mmetsp:Transcript_14446/g.21449  ORF Transcript_14446/g.21449 Transcript_14446/m.21449 type:complete len:361 (+) Transcript_14446:45-1127(+)
MKHPFCRSIQYALALVCLFCPIYSIVNFKLNSKAPFEVEGEISNCIDSINAFNVSLDSLKVSYYTAPNTECKLVRFDEKFEAAAKVLEGKHLVMIGDSLTRYQYLSLVYFLESGKFSSPHPSQTWEKEYNSWNQFYQITNHRLNGNEVCDCFRVKMNETEIINENRYYHNPLTNVRITYLQWFGSVGMGYHPDILKLAQSRDSFEIALTICHPGTCDPRDPTFVKTNPNAFIKNVIADLNPHFVVMNCGHWKRCGSQLEIKQTVAAAVNILEKLGLSSKNFIWKSTTHALRQPNSHEYLNVIHDSGAQVMPAYNITYEYFMLSKDLQLELPFTAYTDNLHFREFVYRELNIFMLNMLANS